jgi:pyruvate formate lyase activating enzyme
LTSYGRTSGFRIDPIEKKPLYHFYPGSQTFSFGTIGCNLGCRYCQNWDITTARDADRLSEWASPETVVEAARQAGCRSIAFTYNDPVIFAEYAIDCAREAHRRGLKTVAVSAGYITPKARGEFFAELDTVNIDLKAFSNYFYRHLCLASLGPILDTLRWLKDETQVWLEVTTLLIPGYNDSVEEVGRLCTWFVRNLGPAVPLHFTAFQPDFKLSDVPPTPGATLYRAREQALSAGLQHVYIGNIPADETQTTTCAGCGRVLIERSPYIPVRWNLTDEGCCRFCGTPLAGRFDPEPG